MLVTTEDLPGWQVATDGPLTVALDISLTNELVSEGTARELINRIQNLRKDNGFEVSDRISVKIEPHDLVLSAVEKFGEFIKNETLANSLEFSDNFSSEKIELFEGVDLGILVAKN